eukprot:6841620-Heterocapsa_arctica.AAC.1
MNGQAEKKPFPRVVVRKGGATQGPKDQKAELEAVKQTCVGSQKDSEDLRRNMDDESALEDETDEEEDEEESSN